MSNQVQFEEENNSSSFQSRAILGQFRTPKMIRFLVDKGLVKNEKAAGNALVAITVICILLMIFIFYTYVLTPKKQPLPLFSPEDFSAETNIQT